MKSVTLKKIVLIGASTGGPGQIEKIISSLPILRNSSIIIAQHMVVGFLESFASRMQSNAQNNVSVITNKQKLQSNHIYVAEGNTFLHQNNFLFETSLSSNNSYNPNINILFSSFVPLVKELDILCVILTGIGDDGVNACKELSNHGARCITESEKSAIVDGMPNRARSLVDNIEVHDINEIIKIIHEFCNV